MLIAEQRFNDDGTGIAFTTTGAGTSGIFSQNSWNYNSNAFPLLLGGAEGGDYWGGRNLAANIDGNGNVDPRIVDVGAVDVSAYDDAVLYILLAASAGFWESGQADYLRLIAHDNDTGIDTLLDEFLPTAAAGGDLQGTISGVTLGGTFQELSYALPADIDSLNIRIEAHSNSAFETVGFDWLRIRRGPEPSTGLLLGFGFLLLAAGRRRSR